MHRENCRLQRINLSRIVELERSEATKSNKSGTPRNLTTRIAVSSASRPRPWIHFKDPLAYFPRAIPGRSIYPYTALFARYNFIYVPAPSVREPLAVWLRFACELERYVGIPRPYVLSLDARERDSSAPLDFPERERLNKAGSPSRNRAEKGGRKRRRETRWKSNRSRQREFIEIYIKFDW